MTTRDRSPCAAIRMKHLVDLIKASNNAWRLVERLETVKDRISELNKEADRAYSEAQEELASFRTEAEVLGQDIDKMLRKTDRFTDSLDKKREILRAHLNSNSQLYTVFKLLSVTSAYMVSREAASLQCDFYASYKPDQKEPTAAQVKLEHHLMALHEASSCSNPSLPAARAIKDVCTMIHDCFAERRDRFEDLCSCVEKQMDYFAQKRDEEFTELMERRTNLQRTRRERVTQIRRKRSNIYKEIAVLNSEASKLRDLLPVVFETMTELIPQLCIFSKEALASQT